MIPSSPAENPEENDPQGDGATRLVVIGGGIGGLAVALGAARRGQTVTVLEHDQEPPPSTPDAAFADWPRQGVPQFRQGHNFLARTRLALAQYAPDVLDALREAGAGERNQAAHIPGAERTPDDGELVSVTCRRTTFEWVLRTIVAAQPGIELCTGATAVGLRFGETSGAPMVIGVRLAGAVLPADLVVDAAGRRSPVRRWLRDAGVPLPPDTIEDCGITYVTRHYRLLPGARAPELRGFAAAVGDLGYLWYAVALGDRRTFSVFLGVPPWDSELRTACLRRFDAVARSIPVVEPWIDRGLAEPLMGPAPMAGNHNALRPFFAAGRLPVLGVLPVADALCTTDPVLGSGVPMALTHGFALAEAVAAHPRRPLEQADAYQQAVMPEVEARFAASVAEDRERLRRWRGEPPEPGDPAAARYDLIREGVLPGTAVDAHLCRAWLRRINMLSRPDDLLADPELVQRAEAVRQQRAGRAPRRPIPSRADLLAMAVEQRDAPLQSRERRQEGACPTNA